MTTFTNSSLWQLVEDDEVLKGYIDGAFADYRRRRFGVLLGNGSQTDLRSGLLIQIADGSTDDKIHVVAKWEDTPRGQSSTIDTGAEEFTVTSRFGFLAELEDLNEDGMTVTDLRDWLTNAADEVSAENYPSMESIASDVASELENRGHECEYGVMPDGKAWFQVDGDDEGVWVAKQLPEDDPERSCHANLWLWVGDESAEASSLDEAVREIASAIA